MSMSLGNSQYGASDSSPCRPEDLQPPNMRILPIQVISNNHDPEMMTWYWRSVIHQHSLSPLHTPTRSDGEYLPLFNLPLTRIRLHRSQRNQQPPRRIFHFNDAYLLISPDHESGHTS
jgi:hypothetical protein